MALVVTSPPSLEPVSLDEVKAHLRIDGVQDDVLLSSLILTSRLHVEAALGLSLITQGQKWTLDWWPDHGDGAVELPVRPVQSVTAINIRDASGTANAVSGDLYELDGACAPARLLRKAGEWPRPGKKHNGIEIDLLTGYGAVASDVPEPIRLALLQLVAHWYEHRDPVEIGSSKTSVPDAVSEILQPFRLVRL